MLRLSVHARGSCAITLTHRALPLILALSDYKKDPKQQVSAVPCTVVAMHLYSPTASQERAVATMGNLALEKFNRYQLGCGGVLDELKQMLLDDANSDAFKAQCLRVAALIVSTNNPTGEAVAAHPCHNFHSLPYTCPLNRR